MKKQRFSTLHDNFLERICGFKLKQLMALDMHTVSSTNSESFLYVCKLSPDLFLQFLNVFEGINNVFGQIAWQEN